MSENETSALRFPSDFLSQCEYAIGTSKELSETGLLNEESLTGALLGALKAALPLSKLDDGESAAADMFWIPYNTGGSDNPWSESRVGADFALLFIDHNGIGRFAMFQAKRSAVSFDATAKKWFVNVRHTPGREENKRTQMTALVEWGEHLTSCNELPDATHLQQKSRVENLHWIHYLAYGNGSPICKPVSEMADAFKKEDPPQGISNLVEIDPAGGTSLFEVMRVFPHEYENGWLTLRTDAAFDTILFWIPLTQVGVIIDKKGWEKRPNFRNALIASKVMKQTNRPSVRGSRLTDASL